MSGNPQHELMHVVNTLGLRRRRCSPCDVVDDSFVGANDDDDSVRGVAVDDDDDALVAISAFKSERS